MPSDEPTEIFHSEVRLTRRDDYNGIGRHDTCPARRKRVQLPLLVVEVNSILTPVEVISNEGKLPPEQGMERMRDLESLRTTLPYRRI